MDLCSMDRQETWEVEHALDRAGFNLAGQKLKYQIETPLTTEFEMDGVNLSGGQDALQGARSDHHGRALQRAGPRLRIPAESGA